MNRSTDNETQPGPQAVTWDPVKFDLAFKGRRLISFDELYKYYRYDGVKSRITSLRYDPWDGVKIAFVLTGLMALIAACMTACHYRERVRQRRLARQAAVWGGAAEAAEAEAEVEAADDAEAEAAKSAAAAATAAAADEEVEQYEQDEETVPLRQQQPLQQHPQNLPMRSAARRSSEVIGQADRQQGAANQPQTPRRESIKVHFHRSQCGGSSSDCGDSSGN